MMSRLCSEADGHPAIYSRVHLVRHRSRLVRNVERCRDFSTCPMVCDTDVAREENVVDMLLFRHRQEELRGHDKFVLRRASNSRRYAPALEP